MEWDSNGLIYSPEHEWLITPFSTASIHTRCIEAQGYLDNNLVDVTKMVRPVLYLVSSVKIASGDGSEQNPYQLSM